MAWPYRVIAAVAVCLSGTTTVSIGESDVSD